MSYTIGFQAKNQKAVLATEAATANQAVRLIRYGKEQSVMAGSSTTDVAQDSTSVMGASDNQSPVAPEAPQVLPQ